MALTAPANFDTEYLREQVRIEYDRVAREPHGEFHFHRGPQYAATFLSYDEQELEHMDADESGVARASFARGLCVLTDSVVAGGSSPSTITLYDLAANEQILSVNLTKDVRNAIHGLEVWPY